jgi:hypothetical protein
MPGPIAQWPSVAAAAMKSRLPLSGELDETRDERIMMYFNPSHAGKLLEGTGHSAAELFELARSRNHCRTLLCPYASARRRASSTRRWHRPMSSRNSKAAILLGQRIRRRFGTANANTMF